MRISDWSSDVCSSDLEPPDLVEDRTAGIDCVDDEYEHQVEQISAEDVRKGHGVVPEMHGRHDGADFRKGGRDTEQHGPDRSEERRVGKEWVSTGRSRWAPDL